MDRIYYGGDYNPDQWDDATIDEDMRLFRKAGINLVTMPVFSWAKLEPEEGVYDFLWLDKLMDKLWQNGIRVCLATPTTAQPAWLSARYPEVLPVDIAGRKRTHGMRVFFCVNSLKYRERAAAIAQEMAVRYGKHPALAMWHVANEYGTSCYCPNCRAQFRVWLRKRYGTVENLNDKWTTSFWGRTFYSFEEVELPTELNDDYRFNPPIQLDYMRFLTDSTTDCYLNEYNVLKRHTPDIPILTNMSGFIKKLDQEKLTAYMDYVGWDNYPSPKDDPAFVAMKHSIMRGLKGGKSFVLTEQSPNQQNWQPYNKLKRPGEVRLLSYQAMAHGADTCLFFQLRQSVGGQEKLHGAVISHAGHEHTRIYREICKLGEELGQIGDAFLGGRIDAKVGILFDWNNWWALEQSSGPTRDPSYLNPVALYYKAFHEKNIPVDIVLASADFNRYSVLIAPMLYMMKPGVAERIETFVHNGGTFAATTMTGLADENDRCIFGEYPGPLKNVLGVWVEETDALFPEESNSMVMSGEAGFNRAEYPCRLLCDVVHPRGAKVLAVYGKDFYQDVPCLTEHMFGKGKAYYIGTEPDAAFLSEFAAKLAVEHQLYPLYPSTGRVEITNRVSPKASVVFVLNHGLEEAEVDFGQDVLTSLTDGRTLTGKIRLAPRDVLVLKR